SVWQFVTALLTGGRTSMYGQNLILNVSAFLNQVAADRVTVLEVVVSYLTAMLQLPETIELPALEYLLVTAASITPALAAKRSDRYPHIRLVNAYGPTEAADDITLYVMDRAP